MSELIRDTVFGHAVRFITNGRVLQYAEEKDPSLWKQYLDRNQTKNMALYGHPDDQTPEEKQEPQSSPVSEAQSTVNVNVNGNSNGNGNLSEATRPETSSPPRSGHGEYQLSSTITGQRIDSEKGRDTTMVTWFGDNDPEVRISLEHDRT